MYHFCSIHHNKTNIDPERHNFPIPKLLSENFAFHPIKISGETTQLPDPPAHVSITTSAKNRRGVYSTPSRNCVQKNPISSERKISGDILKPKLPGICIYHCKTRKNRSMLSISNLKSLSVNSFRKNIRKRKIHFA